jgi:hypothetical protein
LGASPPLREAGYQAAVNAPEIVGEGQFLRKPAQRPSFQSKPLPRHLAFCGKGALKMEYGGECVSIKNAPCRAGQKDIAPVKLLN